MTQAIKSSLEKSCETINSLNIRQWASPIPPYVPRLYHGARFHVPSLLVSQWGEEGIRSGGDRWHQWCPTPLTFWSSYLLDQSGDLFLTTRINNRAFNVMPRARIIYSQVFTCALLLSNIVVPFYSWFLVLWRTYCYPQPCKCLSNNLLTLNVIQNAKAHIF